MHKPEPRPLPDGARPNPPVEKSTRYLYPDNRRGYREWSRTLNLRKHAKQARREKERELFSPTAGQWTR